MIKVKKSIPLEPRTIASFGVQAKDEWKVLRDHTKWFYGTCKRLWTLYVNDKPACVIGLKQNTMLGFGAEVFFMLCRGFSSAAKELSKFIRRALLRLVRLYLKISVRVTEGFWIGEKFVRFFGFREMGTVQSISGSNYKYFELRTEWL